MGFYVKNENILIAKREEQFCVCFVSVDFFWTAKKKLIGTLCDNHVVSTVADQSTHRIFPFFVATVYTIVKT